MRFAFAVIFVVCAVSTLGVVHAQHPGGSPEGKKMKNPVAASATSIAAGEKTFQKMCAFCHGKDGTGNGPMAPKGSTPSNLVDEKWELGSTDGDIFLVIRDGAGPKSVMKGYKGKFTDDQIWHMVNYLRSLAKETKSQ